MSKTPKLPDLVLWLSDSRGRYIPRDFARSFVDRAKSVNGVTADDWAILEAGPDSASNESYWDTWNDVCDCAQVTDEHGNIYRLHQDGDLWLVPEGMEWNDQTESFAWPEDVDQDD